jgi:2-methylcitrate dehydratase PrpD
MKERNLKSQDILKIELEYPKAGAHMIDKNELRSHCAQYVFAVAAVTGEFFFDDILEDRRQDPEINRLYENMEVVESDTFDRTYPEQYESKVILTTNDGAKPTKYNGWAKGTPQNPITIEALRRKFYRLSAKRIPEGQANQIEEWIENAERQKDINGLMSLLRVQG